MPSSAYWAPYAPDDKTPWDLRRVVHLHRRAGFAATWSEIQRDWKDGPQASIDRLLSGKARGQGVPEDFERVSALLADAAVAAGDAGRLKAWWVYRMLFGPDPLGERLTLMWHNHFATSNAKVDDLAAMRRQNEQFRVLGRKPFGELLTAVVRDPAMLIWLDASANRKEHPNENLGRELMELFTLGLGPYIENDVKDAARALTGWTVEDGEFRDVAARHDDGDKTILGKKGAWRGDDLLRLLLDHPATARRLAERIGEQFLGEGVLDAAGLDALAEGLRQNDLRIGWAVETVLRSRTFFADEEPVHARRRAGRIRRRRRPRPGDVRAAAEHGGAGRLDGATGAGPVLSAQRLRLAGWPALDQHALRTRPRPLCGGAGRRSAASAGPNRSTPSNSLAAITVPATSTMPSRFSACCSSVRRRTRLSALVWARRWVRRRSTRRRFAGWPC